ncbi:hypothetical protein ABIG06_006222 [Bradyrhizobium sp. USDA 326]|uniref:hypothetical protein n=1 Tax=unclassified Bradyrhizobium TaxID=2631580 RepID=UPI003515FBD3
MKARFLRFAGVKSQARGASTVGLFLALFASTAHAHGTAQPVQPERGLSRGVRSGCG